MMGGSWSSILCREKCCEATTSVFTGPGICLIQPGTRGTRLHALGIATKAVSVSGTTNRTTTSFVSDMEEIDSG